MMWRWIRRQFGGVVRLIRESDAVVVAAVNGACAGVGMAFAPGRPANVTQPASAGAQGATRAAVKP
jgi:enoyl-CoA hydratase/carnithine racemase